MFTVEQLYQWFTMMLGIEKQTDYQIRNTIYNISKVLAISIYGLLLVGTIAVIITIVFVIPHILKRK